MTVAIDWFGHALQFAHASKTKNGKDPISGVLEACYEELQSLHAKKTLGQRAMRHISSILSYSDEPTRSAAISALASLTEIEKDKLNEARLESLDHYLDELQRRAEEARQSHDYYEGVDDLTPAVDAASQYDIREIDEDLRIGALASALATPKARA